MSEDGDIGAGVPAHQRQGWGQFLKNIASFSGDLSSMTAPPFILSPVSLTEYPSYWGEHPDLFAAVKDGRDEVERMTNVLRWFIATLKGQYTSRNTSMGTEKKPLNPILGEIFLGSWPEKDGRGETVLISEQVSHHPPITAYNLANATAGVSLEGHSGQKTSWSKGSIIVKQVGHAVLRVDLSKVPGGGSGEELYLITLPKLRIDGILYGSPYIELTETSHIQSSTGYTAKIDYSGKGYFSGKAHTFKATLYNSSSTSSHPLAVFDGVWHETSKVSSSSSSAIGKAGDVFWDATTPREELVVKPIEEQGMWESRRVWEKVANGIRSGDYETASREKSKIENEQRQRRKDEQAANTPHQLEYFVHVDDDQEYAELTAKFNGDPPREDAYRRKPAV